MDAKKQRRFIQGVCLICCLFILGCGGCKMFPGHGTSERGEGPEIPAEIRTGAREEPTIKVFMHEDDEIETMDFEKYIEGVVAAEMDNLWPLEALAAQAIIARTYTLHRIAAGEKVKGKAAHVSTDPEGFQAYDADKINSRVRRAVRKTRGKVVTHDDQFIRAWFHAYAGPRTALAYEGLGPKEGNPSYIHIVEGKGQDIIDPEEGSWKARFPLTEIRTIVTGETGHDPGAISSVGILEKGPSGRALRIGFNETEILAPILRLKLGSTEMRSTFIDKIEIDGPDLLMAGTGYGHGVGMCQWGAKAMAQKGKAAEDIISYFYRDIRFHNLW
ncbi:MAG: SpoIID/LytB domain-containing protein [Firmicutes bacterium]|nr:SpoIID/LytB domain-containing protein [Bacillota bacterium]